MTAEMATEANRAQCTLPGGTALQGRIEAIGIFDLLRVAVTQNSTGRLMLFNDYDEAALYYEHGRLIEAWSGSERGISALKAVLRLHVGEFEYTRDASIHVEQPDARLHEVLMLAIKEYYQQRVLARKQGANPAPRVSGVHRVSVPSALPPLLARGELGRARVDQSGRHLERTGQISLQDTACASLIRTLANDIAGELELQHLERFELRSGQTKALLCRVVPAGLMVSKVGSEPDLLEVWQGLEP